MGIAQVAEYPAAITIYGALLAVWATVISVAPEFQ